MDGRAGLFFGQLKGGLAHYFIEQWRFYDCHTDRATWKVRPFRLATRALFNTRHLVSSPHNSLERRRTGTLHPCVGEREGKRGGLG